MISAVLLAYSHFVGGIFLHYILWKNHVRKLKHKFAEEPVPWEKPPETDLNISVVFEFVVSVFLGIVVGVIYLTGFSLVLDRVLLIMFGLVSGGLHAFALWQTEGSIWSKTAVYLILVVLLFYGISYRWGQHDDSIMSEFRSAFDYAFDFFTKFCKDFL